MRRFSVRVKVFFFFLAVGLATSVPWYRYLLQHEREIFQLERELLSLVLGLGSDLQLSKLDFAAQSSATENPNRVFTPRYDGSTYRAVAQIFRVIEQHYVDANRLAPERLLQIGLKSLSEQLKKNLNLTLSFALFSTEPDEARVERLHSISDYLSCFDASGISQEAEMHRDNICRQAQINRLAGSVLPRHYIFVFAIRETGRWLAVPSDAADSLSETDERMGVISAALLQWLEDIDIDQENQFLRYYLNEVLHFLDPHSSFLNEAEYEELRSGTRGQFGGVGVVINEFHGLPFVREIVANSPAQMAGIEPNDILIRVGDSNVTYSSLESVLQSIRKSTKLGPLPAWFFRPHSSRVYQTFFSRDEVPTRSVEERNIPGHPEILLLRVSGFSSRTSQEIYETYMNAMKRSSGSLRSMILDLRGNPGGLLDQAVQVSDLFLTEGKIVVTKSRYDNQAELATPNQLIALPLIVLMNSSSASASEIVAGAIRDSGRGLIIGERSFGKGSVQSLFEISKYGALKLTIAHYFTPSNKSIQGTGVMPHIEIRLAQRKKDDLWVAGGSEKRREEDLKRHLDNPQQSSEPDFYMKELAAFKQGAKTFESPNLDSVWAHTRDDLSSFGLLGQLSFSYPNYENTDNVASLDQDGYVRIAVNLLQESEKSKDGLWSLVRNYRDFLPRVRKIENERLMKSLASSASAKKFERFLMEEPSSAATNSHDSTCQIKVKSETKGAFGKFKIEVDFSQENLLPLKSVGQKITRAETEHEFSALQSALFELPCTQVNAMTATGIQKTGFVGLVGFGVAGHAEQPSAWQTAEFFQKPGISKSKKVFQSTVQASKLFFTGFSSLRDASETAAYLYLKLNAESDAFRVYIWDPQLEPEQSLHERSTLKPEIRIVEKFTPESRKSLSVREFGVHVDFKHAPSAGGNCEIVLAPLVNRNVTVETNQADCSELTFQIHIDRDSEVSAPFDGVVGYLLLNERGIIQARDTLVEIADGEVRQATTKAQLP